jgi:O-antigen ligase
MIKKSGAVEGIYWFAYLALLVSVVFSWRIVTSGSVFLILVISVYERVFVSTQRTRRSTTSAANTSGTATTGTTRPDRSASPRPQRLILYFLVTAGIYSLLYILASLFHNDLNSPGLYVKGGVLAIPLAVYLSDFINKKTGAWLFHAFAAFLALAFIYCLALATIDYFEIKDKSRFFYHSLVEPIRGHAVYLSIYCLVTIIFLMETVKERRWILPKKLHALLAFILMVFLILLASKLVIAFFSFYLLYFIYQLFRNHPRKKQFAVVIVLLAFVNATLIFSTDNPVKDRFTDLRGKLAINERSDPSDYMNGIQFRLLQWKLVPEILSERNSWVTGVGISKAQSSLNEKYVGRNMYQGDGKTDRGYLLYNTHNQFLQDLLQGGLLGLTGFVLMFVVLVKMLARKTPLVFVSILLVLTYSFLESLLETQYGIVIFTFIPLLSYLAFGESSKSSKIPKSELLMARG